ncbi:hypothetical protein SFR_1286 [Streptomyces sp. FR-008]|nr:hypothetical protein SFR_1286 [Streptomyces sp. FR-008]
MKLARPPGRASVGRPRTPAGLTSADAASDAGRAEMG